VRAIAEELPAEPWSVRARGGLLAVVAAVPALYFCSGFTVDDALVSARVASHLARGLGHRFNAAGPEVDAVTPLGWAHLLASLGPGSPLEMLSRGRVVGIVAWLFGAALLGALTPGGRRSRGVLVGALLLSAPLGAWASSGMETGLVTLVATVALVPGPWGALAAGAAAAWRPELLAWAAVLAAGGALLSVSGSKERSLALVVRLLLALAPAVVVACVRNAWFGSFTPLAVWAKPSELSDGLRYAAGAFVLTGAPLLLLAPVALRAGDGRTRLLALAVATHFVAVALAGGDWMALYRLIVPVLPTTILAAARLSLPASPRVFAARSLVAALGPAAVWLGVAVPGRAVLEDRLALIEGARKPLSGARSVACLDVGWVGAATDASILDLAGITDPVVARLPGGHTSKRIPEGLFENRGVDAVVLLLGPETHRADRWQDGAFARVVEQRVAAMPVLETFRVRGELPLGRTRQHYVIVRR
jgi:hypothetical protein